MITWFASYDSLAVLPPERSLELAPGVIDRRGHPLTPKLPNRPLVGLRPVDPGEVALGRAA